MLVRLSVKKRRNARPDSRPYIACGRVTPDWVKDSYLPILLKATVNTSCAGFKTVPCYEAHLEGPRTFDTIIEGITMSFFAESLTSIHNPQQTQFDMHALVLVLLRSPLGNRNIGDFILSPERVITSWKIAWMGVE